MTGPLAAKRPTEDEVRKLLITLLAALGDTQKAVAATLLAGEHLGEPNACQACPVANYMRAGLRAADWKPDVVKVSRFDVQIGWYGVAPREDDMHVYVDLPKPVGGFVVGFDLGAHTQLRAS